MKFRKTLTLALALVMLFCMAAPTYAAREHSVVLKIGSPHCTLDGQLTMVDTSNSKVVPVAESGRTLLPIRRIVEHFGGSVGWNGATSQVTCSLNGHSVILTLGSKTALVDGKETTLDVPAKATQERTLVPLRFVSENLKLNVKWEPKNNLVIVSDQSLPEDAAQCLTRSDVKTLLNKLSAPSPVTYVSKSFSLASGTVKANVVTVNLSDPGVRVEARHVNNKLNNTASFANICKSSGAEVIVNANFFESYQSVKDPIGTIVSNGNIIYCNNGVPSLGFTADKKVYWGDPAVFMRVRDINNSSKNVSGDLVNVISGQSVDSAVLYTPARGSSIAIKANGYAMTISGGAVTGYNPVSAGSTANIPSDGYLLFIGKNRAAEDWVSKNLPAVGSRVVIEPYSYKTATEDFAGSNVLPKITQLISGAPRLLKDGSYCYDVTPGFDSSDSRFTTAATRTAIGTTADGKLIIINTPAATIQQLRELMKQLGCVDATNLDGGASTAMYVQGKTITSPSRNLTSTLQIFVD